jgi:hypothetical protein
MATAAALSKTMSLTLLLPAFLLAGLGALLARLP